MKINYRFLESKDIEQIYTLCKICFSTPWSLSSIKAEIANPLAKYIVATEDNTDRIIGFVGVWIIAGEGDVTNIAVHPNFRRFGIASNLLETLISHCIKNECSILNLEVRDSNIGAQHLYYKFGFKQISIRKKYYSDTKEDAIIMQLHTFKEIE